MSVVNVSSTDLVPWLDSSWFGLRPSPWPRATTASLHHTQNIATVSFRDICTNIRWRLLVDFETFQRVLNRPGGFRDPGEPDEYCRGFQVFDKDMTGFIGVGQLKYILTNLGEKMTDEEVDELLKAVDTSSGQVNYTGKSHARTHPPFRTMRVHGGSDCCKGYANAI